MRQRALLVFWALMLLCVTSTTTSVADEPIELPEHWRTASMHVDAFDSWVFVASTGPETAPPIILIHGLGQAGLTDWLEVIPALEKNYHVIALDLPGFGRSEAPRGKYSPTNYAAVVHQVKQQFTRQPVRAVGHSMGGAVALRYADLYPQDLEKLVLVDAAGILDRTAFIKHSAGAFIDNKSIPRWLESFRGLAGRYTDTIMEKLGQLPDPTRKLGNYQLLWGTLLTNNTNVNAAMSLVNEDFTDAVYDNQVPTWIIWGREDNVAPLRTGKMLAGQMDNAALAIIDNAGHVPMKSHSQEFSRNLLLALTEQPNHEKIEEKSQGSLTCEGEGWSRHSGTYDNIVIRRCRDVLLEDVVARNLVIVDSDVELDNVTIKTERLAAVIERSRVVATNLQLSGKAGMIVSDARMDLAGVFIDTTGTAIEVVTPSEFIFSIGRLDSVHNRTNLHGQHTARPGVLDYRLQ